jgi:FdhD protein
MIIRDSNKDDSKDHPDAVRFVHADRISTGDAAAKPEDENVCVIQETPITIDVEGVESYTLLCTPIDKQALAVGFVLSEGVVERMADIKILKVCDDDPDTIRVRLVDKVPKIADAGRNLMIVSSCGACGSENLKKRIEALPKVGNTLKIEAALLPLVYNALRQRQSLFEACGGTHAAAVFDKSGKIISCAEDTGRHNALDKAIGKCLLADITSSGRGAALTSRLSLEMVSKCARAGIELITAVSAPTTLAIDVARRCNITLCAFVRQTRATVFTYPERVLGTRR